jgi:hypothetical protein
VNLDPIAEWVSHEEPLPRRRATVFGRHAGGRQLGSHLFDVLALQTKVPIGIRRCSRLFDGKVQFHFTCVKPNASASSNRLGLGNLAQAQHAGVERASRRFAILGDRDIHMRKPHFSTTIREKRSSRFAEQSNPSLLIFWNANHR